MYRRSWSAFLAQAACSHWQSHALRAVSRSQWLSTCPVPHQGKARQRDGYKPLEQPESDGSDTAQLAWSLLSVRPNVILEQRQIFRHGTGN